MGRITLLRHGQTDFNATGLLQGRVDNPLNSIGILQAQKAAQMIGPVDRVISSPLKRAIQTAEVLNTKIELSEQWIELDYGDWDGTPVASISKEVWEEWKRNPNFAPPNGESLYKLGQRVRSSLESFKSISTEHVLIVAHVSPIKAAIAWALGVGDEIGWRTRLDTASYSQIRMDKGLPTLTKFNITHET